MAHLKSELRDCCKDCIYLDFYDDRQFSWFYCGFDGDAYCSTSCKNVNKIITSVFEKRDGYIVPRFYPIEACASCTQKIGIDTLISAAESNKLDLYTDAIIHVLHKYGN